MDELVLQAMAKWPNVPDCYGWLGLDARGDWFMRDDRVQAAGAFSSGAPGSKGAVLRHDKLLAFIGRNYAADARGCWFFQNGPQRVFVELAITPLVWRVYPDGAIEDHCHSVDACRQCCVDEDGHLYLQGSRGFGLVHSQDVGVAAELIERGRWKPEEVLRAQLPERFGFVCSPQAFAASARQ